MFEPPPVLKIKCALKADIDLTDGTSDFIIQVKPSSTNKIFSKNHKYKLETDGGVFFDAPSVSNFSLENIHLVASALTELFALEGVANSNFEMKNCEIDAKRLGALQNFKFLTIRNNKFTDIDFHLDFLKCQFVRVEDNEFLKNTGNDKQVMVFHDYDIVTDLYIVGNQFELSTGQFGMLILPDLPPARNNVITNNIIQNGITQNNKVIDNSGDTGSITVTNIVLGTTFNFTGVDQTNFGNAALRFASIPTGWKVGYFINIPSGNYAGVHEILQFIGTTDVVISETFANDTPGSSALRFLRFTAINSLELDQLVNFVTGVSSLDDKAWHVIAPTPTTFDVSAGSTGVTIGTFSTDFLDENSPNIYMRNNTGNFPSNSKGTRYFKDIATTFVPGNTGTFTPLPYGAAILFENLSSMSPIFTTLNDFSGLVNKTDRSVFGWLHCTFTYVEQTNNTDLIIRLATNNGTTSTEINGTQQQYESSSVVEKDLFHISCLVEIPAGQGVLVEFSQAAAFNIVIENMNLSFAEIG